MKKFLSVIATIKTGACLCFTAWAAVWGVLALVFWPDASLRAGHILSMLAASLWIGFLQWLCFVRETGHRVSYGRALFCLQPGCFQCWRPAPIFKGGFRQRTPRPGWVSRRCSSFCWRCSPFALRWPLPFRASAMRACWANITAAGTGKARRPKTE